jgi:hypothetical protein
VIPAPVCITDDNNRWLLEQSFSSYSLPNAPSYARTVMTGQLKGDHSIKRKSKSSVLLLIFHNFYNPHIIKLSDHFKMNFLVLANLDEIILFLLMFVRMDELEIFFFNGILYRMGRFLIIFSNVIFFWGE